MENQQTPEEEFEFNVEALTPKQQLEFKWLLSSGVKVRSITLDKAQEANEINVCFSKPYQKLQRELFEKKKEIESFKEANAKLVEALRISIRHTSELRSLYGSDAGVETIEDIEDNLSTMRELLQTYETK